jgi:hypothetical protein
MRMGWRSIGFVGLAAVALVLSAYQGAAVPPDSVITHDPGSQGWGYHGGSSSQGYSPIQPIRFPHPKHVKLLGMNCVYCHFSANKAADVGMPAVSTCMGCHLVVATQKPEIKKLTEYWNKKEPVPWVRIHKVPEYVHFPHMRHVNAGVTCQTCHGQVQEMYQVYQFASLNMGWCINCHVNGYSPAEGDKAAGSAVALGPKGAASKANLQPATAAGTALYQAVALVDSAALPAGPNNRNIGPSLSEPRHRARYDCGVCHY